MTREFSQVAVETNNQLITSTSKASQFCQAGAQKDAQQCIPAHLPGMSQYSESHEFFEDVDMEVGTEDSHDADQEPAAISQRCEFFELSPR